jgi:D-alanyl-D-alanine dipeptidase
MPSTNLALLLLLALSARNAAESPVPREARQLLVVVTPGWDDTQGTAFVFNREPRQGWRPARAAGMPVSIGRTGLAWGRGLHGDRAPAGAAQKPVKREGDGRAPAGVFRLGPATGYGRERPADGHLSYTQATPELKCVDDVASRSYNRIVDTRNVPLDWSSAEDMRREDELYRLVVVVQHNDPPEPGAGSCIFLHQRRGPGSTTAGCTAFDAKDLDSLVGWLDPDAAPVLVQLPRAEYERRRAEWGLPPLSEPRPGGAR